MPFANRRSAHASAATPAASRPGALILAVDDDPTSRAAIIATLEGAGYRVQALASYAAWQDACKGTTTADLLVLDIMLAEPQRNGYEILRTLRKYDQRTPVIMLSSRHTPTDTAFALASKANAFVNKSHDEFNNPEHGLLATVNALLAT